MGLDNLDQNYYDPNGEGDNHPWGHKSNYKNWEYYKNLLKSGMFWEFHPDLSGEWEKDKDEFFKYHNEIKDRLNMNKSLLADEIQPKLTKTFNQEEIEKLRKIIEEDNKRLKNIIDGNS